MNLLWQKESKNPELYVDIFRNGSAKTKAAVDRYAKCLAMFSGKMAALNLAGVKTTFKNNEKSFDFRTNGNKQFKEERWMEAMSLYNQSLCYAEIGSENVSLAYANRASCFLRLEMYEKCLADIELAKRANYPKNLMPKLDKRRQDCLRLMKTYEKQPKLSYEEDERFPGMANVLEIRCDKKFGRHIVAKVDIPAGQTILAEKAFIARLMTTDYNTCAVCMNISMNFIACTRCTDALFCNESCANADNIHKIDCGESKLSKNPVLEYHIGSIYFILSIFTNVNSLIEFVEEAVKKERIKAPHSLSDVKSKFHALLQLSSSKCPTDEKMQAHMDEANSIYHTLQLRTSIRTLFDTEKKKRFLMHLVLHLNCVMINNGFSVSDLKMSVYIIASYFNHACAPNVAGFNTDENVRYCRTVRPIKAGQQLFITYFGDLFCEKSVEYCQNFLHEKFGFRCTCERCKPNKRLCMMNSLNIQLDPDFQFLQANYRAIENKVVDAKDDMRNIFEKKILDVLDRYGDKHWCEELAATAENYETHFML